jgi:peptidoglycan/LPS O-acetylase OafA/YrhL
MADHTMRVANYGDVMPPPAFDRLRALAIGSQAIGLILIITLGTVMGNAARPWQGVVLAGMLAMALSIALMRLYRRNLARKRWAERLNDHEDA